MSWRVPTWCGTQWAKLLHTSMPSLLSRRSTCLTACLVTRPRACASAWPISATASDAAVITPSVAPANDPIRLLCRSRPYTSPMKAQTSSNRPRVRSICSIGSLQQIPCCSAYRSRPNRTYSRDVKMRGFVREWTLKDDVKYILRVDVADYFGSINQHTLINTLRTHGLDNSLAERLERMLLS